MHLGCTVEVFSFGGLRYLGAIKEASDIESFFFAARPINHNRTYGASKTYSVRHFVRKKKPLWRIGQAVRGLARFVKVYSIVKSSSGIIVGGGELLNNKHFQFATSLFLLGKTAKMTGTPLICLGCSVPEDLNDHGKAIVKRFIDSSRLVATRDIQTKILLESLSKQPIHLYGDCAMQLPMNDNKRSIKTGENLIGLNVKSEKIHGEMYEKVILQIINQIQKKGLKYVLFTTGTLEDKIALEKIELKLINQGQKVEVFVPDSYHDLTLFLQSLRLAICTRLHAAILSMNENVLVASIGTSNKLSQFFDTIGMKNRSYEINHKENDIVSSFIDSATRCANFDRAKLQVITSERFMVLEKIKSLIKNRHL